MSLLFDPLFRVPLLTGLVAALLLPLLGCYLRLRNEWLAALGLAQVAATVHLAAAALGWPVAAAGALGALTAAGIKQGLRREGNDGYALMILGGWAGLYLLAANTAVGEALSHALADGQLYFATGEHLLALGVGAAIALASLPWWSPRLLRGRLFPWHEGANRLPAWRWYLGFDILMALLLALATGTMGVMATFALAFLPPWLAFRLAPNWRGTLIIASLIGTGGYLVAFVTALSLDQPFGPALVGVLLLLTLVGWVFSPRRRLH